MDTTYCTGHLNDGRRFFAELTTAQFNGYTDAPFDATIDNVTGSIEVISITMYQVKDVQVTTPREERNIILEESTFKSVWTCNPAAI